MHEEPRARGCAVRKVLVEQDGLRCAGEQRFDSVWQARAVLARRGLVRVPRGPADEPTLLETWL